MAEKASSPVHQIAVGAMMTGGLWLFPSFISFLGEGGLVSSSLRASNEGLPRPRIARAQEHTRPPSLRSLLVFSFARSLYFGLMSIRKAAGDWEPMLLGIEPRNCKVCQLGLYRDKTMWRGGWSRCARCDEFVHYSCLASGKVSFLKARPRICKTCRAAEQQLQQVVLPPSSEPAPVGS